MGNTLGRDIVVVYSVFIPLKGSILELPRTQASMCRAVPKRDKRRQELVFEPDSSQFMSCAKGPVLGAPDTSKPSQFHPASSPALGTMRSKLNVRSSNWPSNSRPNHTLCLPSPQGSTPTDQPASAPETNIQRPPQLMLPHLATLRDCIPSYSRSAGVLSYLRSELRYNSAGHCIPNASCGRSWLKVNRHSSNPACCSTALPRSSFSTSRCNRSCPPLSWGQAGRPRSRSIPNTTHQADKWLNPITPVLLAKGAPLSLRMASGNPCRSNKRSKQVRTVSPRALAISRSSSTYRLNSSRTVNGSHRWLWAPYHQPLKSTVHTWLGALALRPLCSRPDCCRERSRRGTTNPARSSTRLKLLSLGTCSWNRSYTLRILRGPQCRCLCLSRTISHTTDSSKPSGLLLGRRDNSPIPLSPSFRNLSFHLYPVLGLIRYSRHSSRKLSVLTALNTNSLLWFIGSICCHGIGEFIHNTLQVLPMS